MKNKSLIYHCDIFLLLTSFPAINLSCVTTKQSYKYTSRPVQQCIGMWSFNIKNSGRLTLQSQLGSFLTTTFILILFDAAIRSWLKKLSNAHQSSNITIMHWYDCTDSQRKRGKCFLLGIVNKNATNKKDDKRVAFKSLPAARATN